MFVIDLNYIVPLEELDKHIIAHVDYLNKYHNQNIFVASGRKVPRTGSIIMAVAPSKEAIEKIISEARFYIHKLAEFKVTEFLTPQYHPDFKGVLGESA